MPLNYQYRSVTPDISKPDRLTVQERQERRERRDSQRDEYRAEEAIPTSPTSSGSATSEHRVPEEQEATHSSHSLFEINRTITNSELSLLILPAMLVFAAFRKEIISVFQNPNKNKS